MVAKGVLALLLPTEDLTNGTIRTLVTELLAEVLLGRIVSGLCCESWFVWELISALARIALGSTTKDKQQENKNKTPQNGDNDGQPHLGCGSSRCQTSTGPQFGRAAGTGLALSSDSGSGSGSDGYGCGCGGGGSAGDEPRQSGLNGSANPLPKSSSANDDTHVALSSVTVSARLGLRTRSAELFLWRILHKLFFAAMVVRAMVMAFASVLSASRSRRRYECSELLFNLICSCSFKSLR